MRLSKPLLVLLPGLDGTECLLRPLLGELDLETRVIEYPAERGTDHAALLPLVLRALPTDAEFVMLGWSYGGPLALTAAAEGPRGLRGVVLASTFVTRPAFYVPVAARHLVRPACFRLAGGFSRAKALLGGYATPELRASLQEVYARVGPEVFADRVRATFTVDVRDALERCPVPLLYLAASRDLVVPRRHAREVQRLRPDALVETIEGPHLALATAPRLAADRIESFAQAVATGQAGAAAS